jgi:hypothetical protein
MKTTVLSRTEFLRWIGEQDGARASTAAPAISATGDVTMAWPSNDSSDDPIIAVPGAELREFMAFVSTYIGTFVPFTAFFRVVALEMLDFLPYPTDLRSDEELRPFVGVVIADAALQVGNDTTRISDLTVQACYAAPSFACARAFSAGYLSPMVDVALQRWSHVRGSLRAGTPRPHEMQLDRFWKQALEGFDPDVEPGDEHDPLKSFIVDVRRAIARGIHPESPLLSGVVTERQLRTLQQESREERVRALDDIFKSLGESNIPRDQAEALLGFVISQVAEGSFAYLSLAMKYSSGFPLVPLWFGAFSAARLDSDVLTASDCLGRRLLRRMQSGRRLEDSITADFNFEEFMIFHGEGRVNKVRTERTTAVDIDLLPAVTARFRLGRNTEVPAGRGADRNEMTLDRVRKLVAEVSRLLDDGRRAPSQASLQSNAELFPRDNKESASRPSPKKDRSRPR